MAQRNLAWIAVVLLIAVFACWKFVGPSTNPIPNLPSEAELAARRQEMIERQKELQRQQHKQAITEVLSKLVEIVQKTPPDTITETYWDNTDKQRALVDQLRALDLTQCPEDFQSAYVDWNRAVSDHIEMMSKYKGWNGVVLVCWFSLIWRNRLAELAVKGADTHSGRGHCTGFRGRSYGFLISVPRLDRQGRKRDV